MEARILVHDAFNDAVCINTKRGLYIPMKPKPSSTVQRTYGTSRRTLRSTNGRPLGEKDLARMTVMGTANVASVMKAMTRTVHGSRCVVGARERLWNRIRRLHRTLANESPIFQCPK